MSVYEIVMRARDDVANKAKSRRNDQESSRLEMEHSAALAARFESEVVEYDKWLAENAHLAPADDTPDPDLPA